MVFHLDCKQPPNFFRCEVWSVSGISWGLTLSVCVLSFSSYDGNSLLSSIECYDPVIDSWEVVTSMATQRCDAGVCVLREKWALRRTGGKCSQEDRQLDFDKMPLKQSNKGRFLFTSMQIGKKNLQCSSLGWNNPSPLEIQLHCGRLHLKRAHHHLHDSLQLYLLLSLTVRLFFQFVFKVQYISTHHKKM